MASSFPFSPLFVMLHSPYVFEASFGKLPFIGSTGMSRVPGHPHYVSRQDAYSWSSGAIRTVA